MKVNIMKYTALDNIPELYEGESNNNKASPIGRAVVVLDEPEYNYWCYLVLAESNH